MTILERLLTINPFSRPAYPLKKVQAVVMHWTASPMSSAEDVQKWFESRKSGKFDYGSAHYAIGIDGVKVLMIPENEVAYHVGHGNKHDPLSGEFYTDFARSLFGIDACNPRTRGPNDVTIGIELCHRDMTGKFDKLTIDSAIELVSWLCYKYKLDPLTQIITHHDVVGWKDCPRYWVNNPGIFDAFKADCNNSTKRMLEEMR